MDKVGYRGLGHTAESLAGRFSEAFGGFVVVGGNVERDEQHQVGSEDSHAGEGGKLLARALAGIWPMRSIGRDEVGVGGKVDESFCWLATS